MKKEWLISIAAVVLILMWWFRYDTNCGNFCVTYDRFTGEWFISHEKG